MNTTQMLTMVHEISKNNQDMASQLLSGFIQVQVVTCLLLSWFM